MLHYGCNATYSAQAGVQPRIQPCTVPQDARLGSVVLDPCVMNNTINNTIYTNALDARNKYTSQNDLCLAWGNGGMSNLNLP